MIDFSTPYLLPVTLMLLGVGHAWWRYTQARRIAEQWHAKNRYRVRSLKRAWCTGHMRFRLTPFRNNDWAVDFRGEVDDLRLGGSGVVRLRVWTDWLGMIDREPEITWDRMPTEEAGPKSSETQWHESQIALLRRIAGGESVFRPDGRDDRSRAEFDSTVEHLLALSRRGLLTCATPIAELKANAQYAAVTDVELTREGRSALERADAAAAGGLTT
jgi:hypothetical protein